MFDYVRRILNKRPAHDRYGARNMLYYAPPEKTFYYISMYNHPAFNSVKIYGDIKKYSEMEFAARCADIVRHDLCEFYTRMPPPFKSEFDLMSAKEQNKFENSKVILEIVEMPDHYKLNMLKPYNTVSEEGLKTCKTTAILKDLNSHGLYQIIKEFVDCPG